MAGEHLHELNSHDAAAPLEFLCDAKSGGLDARSNYLIDGMNIVEL